MGIRKILPQTRKLTDTKNIPQIDALITFTEKDLRSPAELEQQSLMTLLEDTGRSFDVLVIRTRSAMPYASVFLELQPGYWDEASESRLRDRIQHERLQKVLRPVP